MAAPCYGVELLLIYLFLGLCRFNAIFYAYKMSRVIICNFPARTPVWGARIPFCSFLDAYL